MVLTAFASPAALSSTSTQAAASCLKGRVTFSPDPPEAKNSLAVEAKPSLGAGNFPYTSCCPVCSANIAWMAGDSEWATGCPITA